MYIKVSGTKCTSVGSMLSESGMSNTPPRTPSHTTVFIGHRVSMIRPENSLADAGCLRMLASMKPLWMQPPCKISFPTNYPSFVPAHC